jgi:phage RecT family recombinase
MLPHFESSFNDKGFANRFLLGAMELSRREDLKACDPQTVFGAIITAASLKLQLSPVLGQCYVLPYSVPEKDEKGWSRKDTYGNVIYKKEKAAQFQIGYQGYNQLYYASGLVKGIDAAVVLTDDKIELSKGDSANSILKHTYGSLFDREPQIDNIVGAWAKVTLTQGVEIFDFLSRLQIEKRRLRNKSQTTTSKSVTSTTPKGAWLTDYGAMAMKAALLSLKGRLPVNEIIAAAYEADESVRLVGKDGEIIEIKETYEEKTITEATIDEMELSNQFLSSLLERFRAKATDREVAKLLVDVCMGRIKGKSDFAFQLKVDYDMLLKSDKHIFSTETNQIIEQLPTQ